MPDSVWSLWLEYKTLLVVYPLVTKMATGGVMTTISDTIAQAFTATLDGVDFACDVAKTFRLVLFATLCMGPAVHYWNRLMEAIFHGYEPVMAVSCKVALDQTIFTLACNVSTIVALTWAERRPMSGVPGRLRTSLWPLLKANWKVWGPTMCLVYAFVEEDVRPLILNIVSIGWQIFYLTLLRPPTSDKQKDTEYEGKALVELEEGSKVPHDRSPSKLQRSSSKQTLAKLKESPANGQGQLGAEISKLDIRIDSDGSEEVKMGTKPLKNGLRPRG